MKPPISSGVLIISGRYIANGKASGGILIISRSTASTRPTPYSSQVTGALSKMPERIVARGWPAGQDDLVFMKPETNWPVRVGGAVGLMNEQHGERHTGRGEERTDDLGELLIAWRRAQQ